MSKPKYLFLDLETTGLDQHRNRILECAAVVTDSNLEVIGKPFEMVCNYDIDRGYAPDGFVQDMHEKNGLWEDCRKTSFTVVDLSNNLYDFIKQVPEWEDKKPILAGATVHFDRRFLKRWCENAEKLLGHRHLDTSSLKMIMVDVFGKPFEKGNAHRAMADVEESLAQAREIYASLRERSPAQSEMDDYLGRFK